MTDQYCFRNAQSSRNFNYQYQYYTKTKPYLQRYVKYCYFASQSDIHVDNKMILYGVVFVWYKNIFLELWQDRIRLVQYCHSSSNVFLYHTQSHPILYNYLMIHSQCNSLTSTNCYSIQIQTFFNTLHEKI